MTWHFLVQLLIFMIISTLGGVASFHALVYAENMIKCREDINLSMSPVCVALAEIRIVFTKNTIYLVQFIAVEIVISIGVIASYLANFITSPAPRVAWIWCGVCNDVMAWWWLTLLTREKNDLKKWFKKMIFEKYFSVKLLLYGGVGRRCNRGG